MEVTAGLPKTALGLSDFGILLEVVARALQSQLIVFFFLIFGYFCLVWKLSS